MDLSRRQFIRSSLLAAGALLFPVGRRKFSAEHGEGPAYARLEARGALACRVEEAYERLRSCDLCPRQCGVDRLSGEQGFCRSPKRVVVYSAHPHFGEEIPLVGKHGSGTIFFSNCNLRCVFCQNWPIAHEGRGRELTDSELADRMLDLQRAGCRNINLVTPTHVMPHIVAATRIALKKGLRIPLVYNTSGYERVEVLRVLDRIVDIYLPDMKYMDGDQAARYSAGARDYPEVTQAAVREMYRQVGDLVTDEQGRAKRGLMIRHLVMPNRVAGTRAFVRWVTGNLSRSTYVNIMAQYRVAYRAFDYPEIARGLTRGEFLEAMDWAEEAGLTRLDAHSIRMRDFFRRGREGLRLPTPVFPASLTNSPCRVLSRNQIA